MHNLARAMGPRLGGETFCLSYRLLLRRDCQQRALQVSQVLAWARFPRLSETTLCPKVRPLAWATIEVEHTSSHGFWLRRAPSRLSGMIHRSKRKLSAWARARAETWASLCYSRLGETNLLGQKYQFSPLFTFASARHSLPNNISRYSMQP